MYLFKYFVFLVPERFLIIYRMNSSLYLPIKGGKKRLESFRKWLEKLPEDSSKWKEINKKLTYGERKEILDTIIEKRKAGKARANQKKELETTLYWKKM